MSRMRRGVGVGKANGFRPGSDIRFAVKPGNDKWSLQPFVLKPVPGIGGALVEPAEGGEGDLRQGHAEQRPDRQSPVLAAAPTAGHQLATLRGERPAPPEKRRGGK